MPDRSPQEIYDDESPSRAQELLQSLANAGNAEAQFYLGHLADEESPRRPDLAIAWYRKAFDGGFLHARHWIASFLYHGMGTAQDIPQALELFREGALANDNASQLSLGAHLVHDPASRAEGVRWLELSAAQGNPSAEERLAKLHQGDA